MIKEIELYKIFTNTGLSTIKVLLRTDKGLYTASVPKGTSKGKNEVSEMEFERCQKILSSIKQDFIGLEYWSDVDQILHTIDDENFSRIGGNLALALSIASARAEKDGDLFKLSDEKPLFPVPIANIIGGGAHGGHTDWQEFLIIPIVKDFLDAVRTVFEIWKVVGDELQKRGSCTGQNLERAWTTKMDERKTLEFLDRVCSNFNVRFGIDCASSRLWNGKVYRYKNMELDTEKQLDFLIEIIDQFKIAYIEDPFHEEDFESFEELKKKTGILVVGDDLYCTKAERISKAPTNAAIIKPNQVGTLSLAFKAVEEARNRKMIIIPSHRSNETDDFWISDLALVWKAEMIKIGLSDIPKYNRLVEIWQKMPTKMASLTI